VPAAPPESVQEPEQSEGHLAASSPLPAMIFFISARLIFPRIFARLIFVGFINLYVFAVRNIV
jgi:hypothetical protein